ncbi:MAG: O-antigen ligase family protein [Rhodoferax sp.]
MPRSLPNVRFSLICFAALALALPIAFVSLAKVLLILGFLVVVVGAWLRHESQPALSASRAAPAILLALAAMFISSLWSTGSSDQVLNALVKHGRLLVIPVLLCMTRSRREVLVALAFFIGGQIFLLASTWLLFLGAPIPWVISKEAGVCVNCSFAIFSSYLDQSIMTAVLAAVCWHLRHHVNPRYRAVFALAIPALALICVFFIFQGRTGHLVAIMLITLAIAWELPKRLRLLAVLLPLALLLALAAGSSRVSQGLREIGGSLESFSNSGDLSSSSGMRLDLWRRSIQSIAENPGLGTGVGSWSREFRRQEIVHLKEIPINGASAQHQNPHQEYLLWAVELGLPGLALLCAVLLALYRDSLRLDQPDRRATQSVLAALALACVFNCTLYDAMIGDFFCITLALLLALGSPVAAPPSAVPSTV